MILYRVMSDYELKKLMGADVNENERHTLCGINTFIYEKDTEYVHFFKYAEHAKMLLSRFGKIVVQCDIPDSLIDQKGFGYYNSEISVIPECIIKKENFDVNFIKGFQYDLTLGWCTPKIPFEEHKGKYIGTYGELYAELYKDLERNYDHEDVHCGVNDYIVNKLKGKDLDKLLLNYIDMVHENHFPTPKTVFSKFIRRK